MAQNKVKPILMTEFDASTLSNLTWKAINAGGLPAACFLVKIINASDEDVFVSYDGVNEHDYVAATSNALLNLQANAQPNSNIACLPLGTTVYLKGTAGTGFIYLSGWYSPTGGL